MYKQYIIVSLAILAIIVSSPSSLAEDAKHLEGSSLNTTNSPVNTNSATIHSHQSSNKTISLPQTGSSTRNETGNSSSHAHVKGEVPSSTFIIIIGSILVIGVIIIFAVVCYRYMSSQL